MDYEAEYDGYGGVSSVKNFYISHRFQVVRSRNQAIQTLTEKPLHAENTVFFHLSIGGVCFLLPLVLV